MVNKLVSEQQQLGDIIVWYTNQNRALIDFRNKILGLFTANDPQLPTEFIDYSYEEVISFFVQSDRNLQHLTCFNLISATEALLRRDYILKATKKQKTDIALLFREIYKEKKNKAKLKDDIIEAWKKVEAGNKVLFENFNRLLNYRNWLAHGRYWTPKFGQTYDFLALPTLPREYLKL